MFAEAKRYCIHDHVVVEDGPWHDLRSCWFNSLYFRVVPSHAGMILKDGTFRVFDADVMSDDDYDDETVDKDLFRQLGKVPVEALIQSDYLGKTKGFERFRVLWKP